MREGALRQNYQPLFQEAAKSRTDWIQPFCMLILGEMGVFFIQSAQAYSGQSQWMRQIVWLIWGRRGRRRS